MVEITSLDSARVWLEKQSHQVQVCFAARAALRGLPGLGYTQDATIGDVQPPLQSADISPQLLKRPLLLETNAKGPQQLSQMAVDAYRREISNALPDCIEPLENIPGIAFEIGSIAARDIQLSEKRCFFQNRSNEIECYTATEI